jgi:hypothetical protein
MLLASIYVLGATGIALLLVYRFMGAKRCALWGQVCLIASFSLIAFVLVRNKAFLTGAAFAFAALAQIYAIAATRIRRNQGL